MCDFDGIQRGNYFGGEPEVKVGKLKNGKAACKDEITGEMIKGGSDRVVDWIYEGCVIWPLRVVLYLKTGDLLYCSIVQG